MLLRFDLQSRAISEVVFPPPTAVTAASIGAAVASAVCSGFAQSAGAALGAGVAGGVGTVAGVGVALGTFASVGASAGAGVATAVSVPTLRLEGAGSSVGSAVAASFSRTLETRAATGSAIGAATVASSSAGSDPHWASVALLIQGTGQVGDLATDVSTNRFTVATQSTGMKLATVPGLGGVAVSMEGSPTRIATIGGARLPPALNVGLVGDFTLEMEVFVPLGQPPSGAIFAIGRAWQSLERDGTTLTNYDGLFVRLDAARVIVGLTSTSVFPLAISCNNYTIDFGRWTSITIARKNADLRLLMDGAVRDVSSRRLNDASSGVTGVDLAAATLGYQISLLQGAPFDLTANAFIRGLRLTVGVDRTNGLTTYSRPGFPLPIG